MGSLHTLLGASRRILISRLAHLQETLESLTQRIRATVAKVIGDNVGEVVCETLRQILETSSPTPRTYDRYHYDEWQDRSPSRSWWHEEEEPDYDYYRDSRDREHSYSAESNSPPVDSQPKSQRITTAVATGLRAAAWWIRHWWGKFSVAGAVTVAVIATGTSLVLGTVASAGLLVLETVDQISILKQAAVCGSQLAT